MTRCKFPAVTLLILAFALASAAWAQEDRNRDRDRREPPRDEIGRDRDRDRDFQDEERDRFRGEEQDRPDRDRDRQRPRMREDEEGTEEGMPRAETVPPRLPGERFALLQWKLGVYAANTDTGVRITRVLPGSAAFRAGLERNDKIVAVDGYQIGYVNGRLYPLGEELQRRAGRSGRVTLLVQNWRDNDLLNVEAQLDRQRW